MIREPPEWMLWTMGGLMAFLMLLPLLKALAPLPLPRSRPRRRVHLGRPQRLTHRLRPDLAENSFSNWMRGDSGKPSPSMAFWSSRAGAADFFAG